MESVIDSIRNACGLRSSLKRMSGIKQFAHMTAFLELRHRMIRDHNITRHYYF